MMKKKTSDMRYKNNILKDTGFWLALSARYFEAETTQEEERALMRFVTSEYANDVSLDDHSKSVFREVRATMSYMLELGSFSSQKHKEAAAVNKASKEKPILSKVQTRWKWLASTAAAILLFFFLKSVLISDNNHPTSDTFFDSNIDEHNICLASENGKIITDRATVISMMQDSWRAVDIQEASGSEVGEQLKELFDVLE